MLSFTTGPYHPGDNELNRHVATLFQFRPYSRAAPRQPELHQRI